MNDFGSWFEKIPSRSLKWLFATLVFGGLMGIAVYFLASAAFPMLSDHPEILSALAIGAGLGVGIPPHFRTPLVDEDLGPFWSLVSHLIAALLTSAILIGLILLGAKLLDTASFQYLISHWTNAFIFLTVVTIMSRVMDTGWLWLRRSLD